VSSQLLRLQKADEHSDRHATWTELFFDLVFVAAVAQLADGLQHDVSLDGAATFAGLFVPVWWAWTTYAYIGDLFDPDEGLFRLVLLGAMLFAAALAASIPSAFHGDTTGFVIAYACLRADLVALYAWAWKSDPPVRPLAGPHAIGFGAGLTIWLSSLAVAAPGRYVIWAAAIALDLATGVITYLKTEDVPRQRSHMPERFGLFTLIVLGEAVIAVSVGTAHAHWALESVVTASLGFALAAGLWWLYFAHFDEAVFDWALAGDMSARRRSFVYGYGHLLILPALAAVGVGIELAIEAATGEGSTGHAAAVLGVGMAVYLLGLATIQRAAPRGLSNAAVAGRVAVAAAALVLALLGHDLSAVALTALAAGEVVALVAWSVVTHQAE
jgi:low temperature requirement protein LtrA